MNSKTIKLKDFVMKRYAIIMSILIGLCLFSSMWGYMTYPEPTYESESYISSHYTQCGEYDFFAEVTESNPIFAKGAILRDNYPAYFYSISPNATIEFSYGIVASDSTDVEVEIETEIIASAKSRKEDEAPFWTKEYSVERHRPFTLTDNDVYTHSYVIYTQDIQEVINDIKTHLRYSQSSSAEIVTCVTTKGTVNDEKVVIYREYILPIALETSYYQLSKDVRVEETFNTQAFHDVLIEPDPINETVHVVLPLFFLFVLICSFIYREHYFKSTSQSIIDEMVVKEEHEKLSDWISDGKFPTSIKVDFFTYVEIDSLTDLVNVSIDAGSRVIHDKKAKIYFSLSEKTIYFFVY